MLSHARPAKAGDFTWTTLVIVATEPVAARAIGPSKLAFQPASKTEPKSGSKVKVDPVKMVDPAETCL